MKRYKAESNMKGMTLIYSLILNFILSSMVLGADDLSLKLIVNKHTDEEIPTIFQTGNFYVLLSNHSDKEIKINRWNIKGEKASSPFKFEIIEVVDNDHNKQLPKSFFKSWNNKLIQRRPASVSNSKSKLPVLVIEPFGHYVFYVSPNVFYVNPNNRSRGGFPFYSVGYKVQVKLQAIFEGQDFEGRKISLKSKIKDVIFYSDNK